MGGVSARPLVAAALFASFVACQKPEAPTITPKEASVTAVGPQGLQLLVRVEALNPNRTALSAQSVTAKAVLAGKWNMGTVTISKPVVLPPKTPTVIDLPMTMPWADLQTLGVLAMSQGPVPYVLTGTFAVGGEKLNIDIPFSIQGTITREQIASAALKGLPPIPQLPGLGTPP